MIKELFASRTKQERRTLLLFIATLVAFCLIAIIAVISWYIDRDNGKVIIENLSSCAVQMSDNSKNNLQRYLYSEVKKRNPSDKYPAKYRAKIRDGKCVSAEEQNDEGGSWRTLDILIDIDSIKRTYRVNERYIPLDKKDQKITRITNIGEISVTCPEPDERIYDDPDCIAASEYRSPNAAAKKTPLTYDELPGCYRTVLYSATSKSGYNVIVKYEPPHEVYFQSDFSENKAKCRELVEKAIIDAGGALEDYNIYTKE